MKVPFVQTYKRIKRIVVLVVGYTVLLVGIALLVLPGPAFIVIPIGLGILSTEVQWAKRLMLKMKDTFRAKSEASKKRKM